MVDRTVPRPEYPRPQLRRQDWTNLNGEWSFAFDDPDAGLANGWQNTDVATLRSNDSPFDCKITVPFCYQSKLSSIGDTAFHDIVWYARTFESPSLGDERLLLHFGTQVATHEGGHTPFSADVTHALAGDAGNNILVVRAEDPSRDVTIPRGNQYWKERSEGIFYTRTTGIWQTVWLKPINRSRIDSIRLTPDVDAGSIEVEVSIEGTEPEMSLRATVEFDGDQALVLVTASMAAYALARINFPGRNLLFAAIITTLFIPQFVFLMPNYLIVDAFGWLDTLLAVIVPGAVGAFGVFFLRPFFVSMPHELEEAALVDGANRFQIFLRIILPLSKAPLATLAVLSFLVNWNDFLWPVYVLFSPENLTLPPGHSILQNAYSTDYAVVMAGGVVASVPVLLVFILAQKYVIQGVSRSGLKG